MRFEEHLRAVCMPITRSMALDDQAGSIAVSAAKGFIAVCLIIVALVMLSPTDEFWREISGGRGNSLAALFFWNESSSKPSFPPLHRHSEQAAPSLDLARRYNVKRRDLLSHDKLCAAQDADPEKCAATLWGKDMCVYSEEKCKSSRRKRLPSDPQGERGRILAGAVETLSRSQIDIDITQVLLDER